MGDQWSFPKESKIVPGRIKFFIPRSVDEVNAFAYGQILTKLPVSRLATGYSKDYLGMNV